MNKFYVVKIGSKYLKLKSLKRSLVSNIDNAAYWTNKTYLNSWHSFFKKHYKNFKIVTVKFIETAEYKRFKTNVKKNK